ncbi:ribonuclease P protein subunit p40-like [Haliotis rubra]|uniref:ribonuclease P protein subunit p40-like n=1 Tax=Haliotis rubra TaxID=36100 RepID=UPI001EE5B4EA|nr:ribonuclease P protein subunit p40-like [Haliotis rubra]
MSAPFPNASPSGKLVFEKSSFLHKNSRHKKFISEHYFNACVSVLLPGEAIPPNISSQLDNEEAYLVHKLPLIRLIDKEFIEAFVKKGCMYFLSHDTQLDVHDCVALLPSGTLVLNVTKDTYEQLGLEGKPSVFTPRHQKPNKYVIHIDLTADCFMPGRKNYNRVWWCLKDRLNLVFNFLVRWVPDDNNICPSSIQQYFENNGYEVSELGVKQKSSLLKNRLTPELSDSSVKTSDDSCMTTYEWFGAVSCGAKLDGAADHFLNTYRPPDPSTPQDIGHHQGTGFISPDVINRVLDSVRSHVEKNSNKTLWAAVTVHGFADSPVSWSKREHGFYLGGDNLYTYIVFPDQQYWLYSAFSTYDEGY